MSPRDTESKALPGIISALGELNPSALIYEKGMVGIFGRCPRTIQRAVERGELPPPIRMFGQRTWTAASVLNHIKFRMAKEAEERGRMERQIQHLST